jgi:glycosyltransferase involved in cell wall biosynthesis
MLRQLLQADICVLPSITEGFPKARLDAMLCGVPVVTTPVGFGAEFVGGHGERGWVVPVGDSRKLARTLEEVLETRVDWPALRRRCREFAEQFTLNRWTEIIGKQCAEQWGVQYVGGKLVE